MTGSTLAGRLARLEARQRREELVLAKHRRRERDEATRRELRLGAVFELVGGTALDPSRVADWLERAAASASEATSSLDELHRRGDARLLALAASGVPEHRDPNGKVDTRERERRTADRIARGELIVAAGLGGLPRTVMIGLLLATAPPGIGVATGEQAGGDRDDGRRGVAAG